MRIISKRNGFKDINPKHKKQQRLTGRIHNAGEYGLNVMYGEENEYNGEIEAN